MFEDLLQYESRSYSQNGEDGVLARLFEVVGTTNRYFVEFGAGPEGETRNTQLLEQSGWTGLLMDHQPNGKNAAIHREHITAENINGLFAKYRLPEEFDLLSIDIDGNDYWIWLAIEPHYRPRVVVIEYNASIPPTESKAIEYDPNFHWEGTDYFGASLLALSRLGRRKGYKLVYCESTGVNAFFVRADLHPDEPPPVSRLYRPFNLRRHVGPYPPDRNHQLVSVEPTQITGVVLARNEESRILSCLEAFRPHVQELFLIDMQSEDRTVELARPMVDKILYHPLTPNFDAARNIAIPEAQFDWLWFCDADEIIPDQVGSAITHLVRNQGHEFEALIYPFQTFFCGKWMQHNGWWPGYCTARVLRRGHFQFSEILHRGVVLDGRLIKLEPALDYAVPHYSYPDLAAWVEKFNRYTSTEALQLAKRGVRWDWRLAAQAMAHDLWEHYELHNAKEDGNQGWILTWACSQYRWFSIAKLIDHFRDPADPTPVSVPESIDDGLQAVWDELAVFRAPSPQIPLGIILNSPVFDFSGYADEGRAFAKALARSARHLILQENRWNDQTCELPADESALLHALIRARRSKYVAKITNCIPTLVAPDPSASLNLIRTTFETDRIPPSWLQHLQPFDEIWVISTFNRRAFIRSGVPPEKIRAVPSCIDTNLFRPDGPKLDLPHECADRFVFLSVFDWQLRKGWDVLLRAFVSSFSVRDGVALLLKITRQHEVTREKVVEQSDQVLGEFGTSLADRPDIVLWEPMLSVSQMAALYRSVNAFVLPSRGEGWGRPYMEAMATALPVIGTCASGNADFMNGENCFIVAATETDVPDQAAREIHLYAGHRWLEPDVDDLKRQLRALAESRIDCDFKRYRGLKTITEEFSLERGQTRLEEALSAAEEKFRDPTLAPVTASQIRVVLEGEFFAIHSFANVNEQMALELAQREGVALSLTRLKSAPTFDEQIPHAYRLRPFFDRPLDGGAQVTIRHSFPPYWDSRPAGRWIHIQPWEVDCLPVDWVEPLRDRVDEIWAPSSFVRDTYVRSGIPAEKIQIIPWGVDPNVFSPDAPPLHLPTKKRFAFIYVGGTIRRKGFDILLDAYLQEFGAAEDVCLVIKDLGAQSFYQGASMVDRVRAAQQTPGTAEIIYLDALCTACQLASLYTACQCFVAPYRGEGFGLPILEAMACGVPPIVPKGGASDDFTSEQTALLVDSRRVSATEVGILCGPGQELEVAIPDLRRAMRSAFLNRTDTHARGKAAAQFVHERFTWSQTVDAMVNRLRAAVKCPRSSVPIAFDATVDSLPRSANTAFLTLCMELRNDEQVLADCLARIMPFVREAILVDGGCTDRSIAIAREYGARVVMPQQRDAGVPFARWAVDQASSPWILLLRPGEYFKDGAAEQLTDLLAGVSADAEAVDVRTEDSESGNDSAPKTRLFRNRPDVVAKLLQLPDSSNGDGAVAIRTLQSDLEIIHQGSRIGSQPTLQLLEWWLQPWIRPTGRTFIDIGADVGTWTKTLAPFFDHVHSIEPNPDAHLRLESGLPANVTVHRVGAWNRKANVTFTQFSRSAHLTAYFKTEGIHTGPSRGTIRLPCRTIDSLETGDEVDFIKCDTEGAEIECLKGAQRTILRSHPWILVEIHSTENFAKLAPLLIKWGYVFTIIRDPHYEPFSKLWHEHFWMSCQPHP